MGLTNRGGFFQSFAGKSSSQDVETKNVPSLNERSRPGGNNLPNSEQTQVSSFLTDPLSRKQGSKNTTEVCAWAELRERMKQLNQDHSKLEEFMKPVVTLKQR